MRANRLFFSQEAVDVWLAESRVSLDGDVLRLLPDGPSFKLTSAVHIKDEVAGGGDVAKLAGKVKSLEDVTALSGEAAGGSVVVGDDAYEAVDGFLAELVPVAGLNHAALRAQLVALSGEAG
jgi:hypothetical protein